MNDVVTVDWCLQDQETDLSVMKNIYSDVEHQSFLTMKWAKLASVKSVKIDDLTV